MIERFIKWYLKRKGKEVNDVGTLAFLLMNRDLLTSEVTAVRTECDVLRNHAEVLQDRFDRQSAGVSEVVEHIEMVVGKGTAVGVESFIRKRMEGIL